MTPITCATNEFVAEISTEIEILSLSESEVDFVSGGAATVNVV